MAFKRNLSLERVAVSSVLGQREPNELIVAAKDPAIEHVTLKFSVDTREETSNHGLDHHYLFRTEFSDDTNLLLPRAHYELILVL